MKYSDWHRETIKRELPIVLNIVRDRCVYTWTIEDFVEVWNTVGTFPISNGYANKLLNKIAAFGLVEREMTSRRWEYR